MGWLAGGLFQPQGWGLENLCARWKGHLARGCILIPEENQKALVTHLDLIAFRLLRHLWEPGGELCSAHSFTLIVSGVSIRLCPKHEGLRKGKVPASTSCSVFLCSWLPDLQRFHVPFRVQSGLLATIVNDRVYVSLLHEEMDPAAIIIPL